LVWTMLFPPTSTATETKIFCLHRLRTTESHGLGTFGPQQVITTNANGAHSVYTKDLDGDGDHDVVSASFWDDKITWYENLLFKCEYDGQPCDFGPVQDGDMCNSVCSGSICVEGIPVCDDGEWCNGTDTCDAVVGCVVGEPPDCDDGIDCTADSCDEVNDRCVNTPNDDACDDGDWCNGAETCDTATGCVSGNAPDCDDGNWCNGAETCDAVNGCQAGSPPDCDDGVDCSTDDCNEDTDSCENAADDSACDNGAFCDGAEWCDAELGCQPGGGDPCTEPTVCDEEKDACVGCAQDAHCDDGVGCTVDTCEDGECKNTPDDAVCDDGEYCNGAESCDAQEGCIEGKAPCALPEQCDEEADACIEEETGSGGCGCSTPAERGLPGYLMLALVLGVVLVFPVRRKKKLR